MNDDKISSNATIEAALHLDGDPGRVKEFYAQWAKNYDSDVGDARYSGPDIATKLLSQHVADKAARLLDAGCGTGQVGRGLQALGYSVIDGFDLSPEMADQAASTGVYRRVVGDIDMMRALEDFPGADYDALLSIGVFTLGHVPPAALAVLAQLLRKDGVLLVSTRSHYYEQTDFQQQVDALVDSGRLVLEQVIWDAPYNHDGDAHYWVFRRVG
jgi:predicted TPR repeat methyltransferase